MEISVFVTAELDGVGRLGNGDTQIGSAKGNGIG